MGKLIPDISTVLAGGNFRAASAESHLQRGIPGGLRRQGFFVRTRSGDTILTLFVFRKNEQSDLSKDQLKILKAIVAKELR